MTDSLSKFPRSISIIPKRVQYILLPNCFSTQNWKLIEIVIGQKNTAGNSKSALSEDLSRTVDCQGKLYNDNFLHNIRTSPTIKYLDNSKHKIFNGYITINCKNEDIHVWTISPIECDLLFLTFHSILYFVIQRALVETWIAVTNFVFYFQFVILCLTNLNKLLAYYQFKVTLSMDLSAINVPLSFFRFFFSYYIIKHLVSIVARNLSSSMVLKLTLSILFIFPIILVCIFIF
jgi:hypothetical protein